MFLDVAISQTAYAIEILSKLAYFETGSYKFNLLCMTIAKIRHEVAKNIMEKNYEIEHERFILKSSSVERCFDYISNNDMKIMGELEPKLTSIGFALYYQYIYDNIRTTGRLLQSCIDYFIKGTVDDLYKGNVICIDCGWVLDREVSECKMCNGKSLARIDMI